MINFKEWLRKKYTESGYEETDIHLFGMSQFDEWVEGELSMDDIFEYHEEWVLEAVKPYIK